jgi:hypothetical protein
LQSWGGGRLKATTARPSLVVWGEWKKVKLGQQPAATVADDVTESAYVMPTVWGSVVPGQPVTGWVFENYPRQKKKLTLRIYELVTAGPGIELRASAPFDNPVPIAPAALGPQPLPQQKKVAGHDFVFKDWIRRAPGPTLHGEWSDLYFEVKGSYDWRVVSVDVSDATGNQWQHPIDKHRTSAGVLEAEILQPLWGFQTAYRVRVNLLLSALPGTGSTKADAHTVEFLVAPPRSEPELSQPIQNSAEKTVP